nr:ATP-binding protein [Parachlamydiaceae bacterium]
GFLYIDKTMIIHQMITQGVAYFLSRPRRFGKSLLISTLEALFLGKRELFSGLWIDSSDYKWKEYPVLRMDISKTVSSSPEALSTSLQEIIKVNADKYGIEGIERSFPSLSLSALVTELSKKSPVVILIDEYDKPLVNHLEDMDVVAKNRNILRDFYTMIKALDEHLHFVFVTGVSKFSKVSLFSGMNNLLDISLNPNYSTLLGLTEEELRRDLQDELQRVSKSRNKDKETNFQEMKQWYNGYLFSQSTASSRVYNPLSVFQFLQSARIDNYWFSTATPTFAIDLIKKQKYFIPDLEQGIIVGKEIETNHEFNMIDLPTLLFQTGYLTIDNYDENAWTYRLKFPNEEVRRSFLEQLLLEFAEIRPSEMHTILFKLLNHLKNKNLTSFFETFNTFFASIPHQIHLKHEAYYHSLIYLVLKVLGFSVQSEVSTNTGRVDMVLRTDQCIFIFEFKINSNAQAAMDQILDKKYQDQFKLEGKEIILVGANFDPFSRTLNDWCTNSIK